MSEHRIEHYVYGVAGDRNTLMRRQATMRGAWGCEARCATCGVETRTGGAVRSYIDTLVWEHKHDLSTGGWHPITENTRVPEEDDTMSNDNDTPTRINPTSDATTWAWEQISSPNLDFQDSTGSQNLAFVLLAFARLADEGRCSTGYSETTEREVADLTGMMMVEVIPLAESLGRCGLLVRSGRGYRIPEEAFYWTANR